MKKPNNFENTKAQGEFTPVELGGHKLVIKQVSEKKSKNNKDMIVILFDFAADDSQPEYFSKMFADDIRPEKKWPNQATQYILVEDENGNTSRSFKTFCTCVEHSNPNFSCWKNDDSFNFQGIKGKKIGGVFGEQMDFYNGKVLCKHVLRWFTSLDKLEDVQIPDVQETQAYKNSLNGYPATATPTTDGFMNIPDGIDEELPFN